MRSLRAIGLLIGLLAVLVACSGPDGSPATSGDPAFVRLTTDGLTLEYPTDVFADATSIGPGPDDGAAIVVQLRPSDESAEPTVLRVLTVRDGAGLLVDLPSDDLTLVNSIDEALAEPDDSLLTFVNGTGEVTTTDASWTFVGLVDQRTQLVEIHGVIDIEGFDRDTVIERLDRLARSIFVDTSATLLQVDVCEPSVEIFTEVEFAPDRQVSPGEIVTATWRVRNVGTCAWTTQDAWVFTGGHPFTLLDSSTIDGVDVGDDIDVAVTFAAPEEVGNYSAQWQLLPAGSLTVVGPPVAVTIEVGNP